MTATWCWKARCRLRVARQCRNGSRGRAGRGGSLAWSDCEVRGLARGPGRVAGAVGPGQCALHRDGTGHHRQLRAWIGPAIGAKSYEVGDDVRDAFVAKSAKAKDAFVATRPGHAVNAASINKRVAAGLILGKEFARFL